MNKFLGVFLLLVVISFSCSPDKTRINEKVMDSDLDTLQTQGTMKKVAFFQLEDFAQFPDAILELYTPLGNQVFRPGKIPFEFNIKNFPLESSNPGAPLLYTILNGGDPVGQLSPIFQQGLTEGTYRIVGYLVDQEGLALKNFGNYVDRDFLVGDSRAFPYSAEPFLAVNMPKNQEIIPLGKELIVDFLVLGGDMKLDKLKVQIQINEYSYEIDHMAPVRVENLPVGEYQVKVRLVRNDGKELEGPFSFVSKSVRVQ